MCISGVNGKPAFSILFRLGRNDEIQVPVIENITTLGFLLVNTLSK